MITLNICNLQCHHIVDEHDFLLHLFYTGFDQIVSAENAMPNPPSAALIHYPAYCFSLSPTYNTWAKLSIKDVHALHERSGFEGQTRSFRTFKACFAVIYVEILHAGQNLYFYLNHPVKWIRLIGVVVALDIYPTRWIMVLDDSSGFTLEVTCGRPTPAARDMEFTAPSVHDLLYRQSATTKGLTATSRKVDLEGIDIGTTVKVKGGIGTFRDQRQLLLERISIIYTTNEEVTAWADNSAFRKDVLENPWVLSVKEERQAKRKAEGLRPKKRILAERKGQKQLNKLTKQVEEGSRQAKQPAATKEERNNAGRAKDVTGRAAFKAVELRREQERLVREQEFERLRLVKEAANEGNVEASEQIMANIMEKPAVAQEMEVDDSTAKNTAGMATLKEAEFRREHEKRLRQQEFKRLTLMKEEAKKRDIEASKQVKADAAKRKQELIDEQKARDEAARDDVARAKIERVGLKRDDERRTRESEYEKLKRRNEIKRRGTPLAT